MNRKQKIIVSITGITIVMLALLGLTYGYYLTNIYGNTNSNSISITTSDLKLTYRDGTGELIASGVMPGDEITNKKFTVENDGTNDIEAYTVALINIVNNFTFKDDLEVSVSCSSSINSGVCEGFAEDYEDNIYKEKYPAVNSELFSLGIKKDEIHTYTLTVDYLYQEFDQSDDMGKTLKGKVEIFDPKDTIEVSGEVIGFIEGDYAEIHSDIQTSEIVDGKYKFVGISADNHTVYIKNRNTNTEKNTSLEVKKGTTEGITNNVITFTETSKIASVVIDTSTPNLSLNIEEVTSFIEYKPLNAPTNTLAYNLVNNAKNNSNGTILVETPLTIPGDEISSSSLDGATVKKYPIGFVYYYSSDPDMAYYCGHMDDKEPECGISPNSCSEILNKYVYNTYTYEVDYVEGCEGELPYYNINPESTLSTAKDDYGTSYYYRGGVTDNYVNFANMCWRVVRIQGDGSIKLILEDKDTKCQDMCLNSLECAFLDGNWELKLDSDTYSNKYVFGVTKHSSGELIGVNNETNSFTEYKINYLHPNYLEQQSMAYVFKEFQKSFTDGELNKMKSGGWCYSDSAYDNTNSDLTKNTLLNEAQKNSKLIKNNHYSYYYESYLRLFKETGNQPTLKCNGTILDDWDDNSINPTLMYIGTITADEAIYAGATTTIGNRYNYLYTYNLNDPHTRHLFYTLSPSYDDYMYVFDMYGMLSSYGAGFDSAAVLRPAVRLKKGITISSGNGTITNPYVIN